MVEQSKVRLYTQSPTAEMEVIARLHQLHTSVLSTEFYDCLRNQ